MLEQGMLYLCGTPIGNLEDITYRVVRTLKEVDIIACEDTRHSIKLLNHFEITTKMTSYHEFNKYDKAKQLVRLLQEGKNIALITDAGMPGISDPGEELVKQCYEAGIRVTTLPGACALITALTMSGLSTRRFAFEAFLPPDKKERKKILDELETETRTTIIYEAPHHLVATLKELYDRLGNRRINVVKELTKTHETTFLSTLEQAVSYFETNAPRGEYVIVMEGVSMEKLEQDAIAKWEDISIEDHMKIYLDKGIEKKEAMKLVAKDRGIGKREVYQALLT